MFASLARTIFGNANDRSLKAYQRRVPEINAHEPAMEALSDAELQGKTAEFRQRLADGATLDELLPEAFATVREGAKRVLGMRHFDVQMIGGMVLHDGKIAEMKTGEGKTLVATLPVYLNALPAKGVHVVTVNDYLARRDAEWMGQLYNFLGLSTGIIIHGLDDEQRRVNYQADITYGTNNEFGFDYLRDNMKYRLEDMSQREFAYAIVDEVDSILIDEARTPLIISGPAEDSSDLYRTVNAVVRELVKDPETFEKEEKFKTVSLTETGSEKVEEMLRQAGVLTEGNLYDIFNVTVIHHVQQSVRSHTLFTRDVDYIVQSDKVVIIDEFTGRKMEGRRYSDGLHQALEAKEGVTVQAENQTLASITFQNYFRLYPKLSGMTGTAMTEADEFAEIYKLDVVEIPTNVPVSRTDGDDEVYRSAPEKYEAVANLIAEARGRGQPVLVGTTSIEKSEVISELLTRKQVPHAVLNARFHEQEATIVSQAGAPGAVTIATNMAGRGTDIKLGGNLDMRQKLELEGLEGEALQAAAQRLQAEVAVAHEAVKAAGGLMVIGTERHESRRIEQPARRQHQRLRQAAVRPGRRLRADRHDLVLALGRGRHGVVSGEQRRRAGGVVEAEADGLQLRVGRHRCQFALRRRADEPARRRAHDARAVQERRAGRDRHDRRSGADRLLQHRERAQVPAERPAEGARRDLGQACAGGARHPDHRRKRSAGLRHQRLVLPDGAGEDARGDRRAFERDARRHPARAHGRRAHRVDGQHSGAVDTRSGERTDPDRDSEVGGVGEVGQYPPGLRGRFSA